MQREGRRFDPCQLHNNFSFPSSDENLNISYNPSIIWIISLFALEAKGLLFEIVSLYPN